MGIQAFVLRGEFTADDMARFVSLLRMIDEGKPDKRYELVAVDSNMSAIRTAARLLKQVVPPVKGRETVFAEFPTDPGIWALALDVALRRHTGKAKGGHETLRAVVLDMFAMLEAGELS